MAERIEYGGIDHVQLAMPAGREDEARRFYADVLGLRAVPKPGGLVRRGGCWFASADGRIQIHLGIDPAFRPARKAHPALVVGDLDALRERLADAGADVIEDDAIDVRRFYTADPFGNRIELMEAREPAGQRSSQAYSAEGLDEGTLRDRLIDQADLLTGEAIGVAFPGRGAALWHEGRISVLDPVGQPGRELGEAIDALLEGEDLGSPAAVRDALLTMAGAQLVVHRVALGEPAGQPEP